LQKYVTGKTVILHEALNSGSYYELKFTNLLCLQLSYSLECATTIRSLSGNISHAFHYWRCQKQKWTVSWNKLNLHMHWRWFLSLVCWSMKWC